MLGVLSSSAACSASARYWPQYHGHTAPQHCEKTKNMGSALNDGCGLCSAIGDSGSRSVTVRHGVALQQSKNHEVVLYKGQLSSTSKCTNAVS